MFPLFSMCTYFWCSFNTSLAFFCPSTLSWALISLFLVPQAPLKPPILFDLASKVCLLCFQHLLISHPFQHTSLAFFCPFTLSQAINTLGLLSKGVFSLFSMSILISDPLGAVLYPFSHMWACSFAFFYMYRPFFLGIVSGFSVFGSRALFSAWQSGLSGVVNQGDA